MIPVAPGAATVQFGSAVTLVRDDGREQTFRIVGEDEADPESLANYGFNEAFKKPFDVALLGERIKSVVEEKRANL